MFTIEVTQEHINKGERYVPTGCPIALAVRDALKNYTSAVAVGYQSIVVHNPETGEREYTFNLPADALAFLYEFDADREVAPFTFTVINNY